MIAKGLSGNEPVAEIFKFYPNGYPSEGVTEESAIGMRQSVGCLVLNRIIDDCRYDGVRMLCVETKKSSMKGFMRKHVFHELPSRGEMVYFYKIL